MLKSLNRLLSSKKASYSKIDQLRYLSQSALIEETTAPYMVRTTLFMISVIIITLIVWSGFTEVEEIAVAQGEVIPSKHVQSIQHLEGGIISEIKVVEGELVNAGQTIIILDGTAIKQDLSALNARKLSLEYQILRLRSFINKTTPDFGYIEGDKGNAVLVKEQMSSFESMLDAQEQEKEIISEQIMQKEAAVAGYTQNQATLKDRMDLITEERDLKQKLNKKGHLSRVAFLQVQKQFNDVKKEVQENNAELIQAQNSILEYQNRLESLEANYVDAAYKELSVVDDNLTQVKESIKKLKEQVNRLEVISPSYGFIKVLNIKTIGGVIESGQVLAQIVPLEGALILEIQIQPKDIGYMKTGQPVNVKVSSYDFSRYGTIDGILEYISATTFTKDDNSRYYMGRVSIAQNHVEKDPKTNIIVPGMTVQADIVTGSKSILAYLLKPLHNSITSAFSER